MKSLVSTHSRPKAAGETKSSSWYSMTCFNTQPPEGGWNKHHAGRDDIRVSTHSRPKAAGCLKSLNNLELKFQHTAARRRLFRWFDK